MWLVVFRYQVVIEWENFYSTILVYMVFRMNRAFFFFWSKYFFYRKFLSFNESWVFQLKKFHKEVYILGNIYLPSFKKKIGPQAKVSIQTIKCGNSKRRKNLTILTSFLCQKCSFLLLKHNQFQNNYLPIYEETSCRLVHYL